MCAFVIPGRIRHPLASNRRAAGDTIAPCGAMRETAPFSIKMSDPCRAELSKSRMCPPARMIGRVPRGCRSIDANADCTGRNLPCCAKHGLLETLSIVILDKSKTQRSSGERICRLRGGRKRFTKFGLAVAQAASRTTACISTAAPASRCSGRGLFAHVVARTIHTRYKYHPGWADPGRHQLHRRCLVQPWRSPAGRLARCI